MPIERAMHMHASARLPYSEGGRCRHLVGGINVKTAARERRSSPSWPSRIILLDRAGPTNPSPPSPKRTRPIYLYVCKPS